MSDKNYASPPLNSQLPIGIFDSGIGGLTVLKALFKYFPHEDFIYFGDTARLPYGTKSAPTIQRYSYEIASFLEKEGIKALVIACNTATALAKDHLQSHFSFPLVDVISPTVTKALSVTKTGKIAILATRATIRSQKIQQALLNERKDLHLYPVFCPLFVPFIEEQMVHHPSMQLIIDEYLAPLKETAVDTIILACTHYPLLMNALKNYFGEKVVLIDSGEPTAQELMKTLEKHQLLRNERKELDQSSHRFIVSDDPDHFKKHGRYFLGEIVDHVELCSEQEILFL